MIAEYIRDKNGNKRGLVVALKRDDGHIGIGWSLCNKKDEFDRDRAWFIAVGRANKGSERENGYLPAGSANAVQDMVTRAFMYFHVNDVIVATL